MIGRSFLIIFFIFIFFLTACGPVHVHTTQASGESIFARTSPGQIAVFKEGQPAPQSYRIIGKVFIEKRRATIFEKVTEDNLIESLQGLAAGMGADALWGVRFSDIRGCGRRDKNWKWASGIAIKFMAEETEAAQEKNDFIVAILPVIDKQTKKQADREKYNAIMRNAAYFQLEVSGYYPIIPSAITQSLSLADLRSMDKAELALLGGREAGLVLLLTLSYVGGSNIGIVAGANADVTATLISKDTSDVVWKSRAEGEAVTFGLISLAIEHREAALCGATINVLSTLPRRGK